MTSTAAATALLLTLLGPAAESPSTTVAAPRSADIDDARGELAGDALALAAPEDALFALGGDVAHDGGPLSPSRILVRGLSGARLAVSFDGVPLGDPAGTHFDAALLPWAFSDALTVESGAGEGLGGAVRLTSGRTAEPAVRARALVGELSTARLQGLARAPLPNGSLALGLDAASTRGDFAFLPAGAAPGRDAAPTMTRDNNDQQRASALAAADTQLGEIFFDATLLAAGHRGGIPGFALAPTRGLRGEDGLLAGALGAHVPVGGGDLGASVALRGSHRATEGAADARSAVQTGAADLLLLVRRVALGDGAVADVHARTGGARVFAGDTHERTHSAAGIAARATLGPVRLRVRGEGEASTDTPPLFSGEARLEAGGELRASLGVARAARAPSLDERYAPTGFVLGNPALRPELAHDVEVAVAFLPGRLVSARAVAFAGRIDDAIVYTNRNAYQVGPDNTGAAWRAGLDTFITVEPSPWCGLTSTSGLLASRLDATGAPLPLAPPWSSRTALRVGRAAGLNAQGILRARGPSSSNHFGTLVAPPVALLDLVARAPIASAVWLSVALTNALDVRDARDQNQLPLPGRLAFVALEVTP